MDYTYLFSFLLALPLIWNILYCLKFDSLFKQGKIWQIKLAYVFSTIIVSHLLASAISGFVNNILAMF